jgi:2-oxo-4-hydroxy-4-carboxy-5-ureidoimidazoline decarboxylase
MTATEVVRVAELDRATAEDAARRLRPSCASACWIDRLVGGRPYESLEALTAASDAAIAALSWPDIEEALAAHPRIGDRAPGRGREASWSRQEQAAAAGAGADIQARLRAGNAEYEERFGHVFLICATGRSATEMLSALHGRLGHDAAAEREIVRSELVQIVRLRLAQMFR